MPGAQPALPPAPAAARLGGKGSGLLRLRALGAPVPELVVLPTALFAPVLAGVPTTAAGLAERRARPGSFEVPARTQAALRAGWGFGPGQPVAVRSSVADEDGTAAAFGGMMERMMGVLEPVDFVRDQRKTLAQRLALLPRLALPLGRLLGEFARLPGQVRAFRARFEAEYQRFYQLPLASLGAADLLRETEHLSETLLTRWTTPIINGFRVMMAHSAATRHLARLGVADPGGG